MAENNLHFAAVYIRVSTEDQAELSPDTQLEKIRDYARSKGIVILQDNIYVDAGISGKKAEKRPEFMRMIAAAKEKDCPFTSVLVWKFSRFARNQEESIFYKSILRSKCGVEVISVSEPLIAGHFGSLIERIIEWMDEFYSIRLSEEVKRSMEVNARRGKLQSSPSFGYRAEGGKLVEVPEEAELVRHIFQSVVDQKGLYQIARELNAAGIQTHRGNPFENRTVEYIIRNPVYIGKLRWNPTGRTRRDYFNDNIILADSEHTPIVDKELWEAANKRLDDIKLQWGYKSRPTTDLTYWLSGLIRCSSCGATLIFSKPHYYKCSNFAKGRCSTAQHIRREYLEAALIERLQADAESTQPLACDVTRTASNGGKDIERLEATLRSLDKKKQRLQDAYLSGVIELADFSAAKKDIENAVQDAQEQLAKISTRNEELQVQSSLQAAINNTLKILTSDTASLQEKNNAARQIIGSCVFNKEKFTLEITYRITL